MRLMLLVLSLLAVATACGKSEEEINRMVDERVAATVTASAKSTEQPVTLVQIVTPTPAPTATPTPLPTSTPNSVPRSKTSPPKKKNTNLDTIYAKTDATGRIVFDGRGSAVSEPVSVNPGLHHITFTPDRFWTETDYGTLLVIATSTGSTLLEITVSRSVDGIPASFNIPTDSPTLITFKIEGPERGWTVTLHRQVKSVNSTSESASGHHQSGDALELMNFDCVVRRVDALKSSVSLEGEVRNISGKYLANVAVVAEWYTYDDQLIGSDSALIEMNPLPPNQVISYKVTTLYTPIIKSCSIRFEYDVESEPTVIGLSIDDIPVLVESTTFISGSTNGVSNLFRFGAGTWEIKWEQKGSDPDIRVRIYNRTVFPNSNDNWSIEIRPRIYEEDDVTRGKASLATQGHYVFQLEVAGANNPDKWQITFIPK